MNIYSAEFIKSSKDYSDCPVEDEPYRPEYAFIGRSNVGKSSLINYLTLKKNLAKTSSTPGKTRLINHFLINNQWYLADLPGYGYAKVSKKLKAEFSLMIENYILKRKNLVNLFILIDSRLEPQAIDLNFINQLGESQVPFSIVFTKVDKVNQREFAYNFRLFSQEMKKKWEELPIIFKTSSEKKIGREEILSYIEEINHKLNKKIF